MTAAAHTSCSLTIAGERIDLLPERAAFWPSRRTLILADVHLGKCESLRAAGMPIPPGVVERDLERLATAAARAQATRILVVGDLLHHATGLTPELIDTVAQVRRGSLAAVEIALVRGNHDRRVEAVLDAWGVSLLAAAHLDGPFGFSHDPADGLVPAAACTWFGHIHPLCRIGSQADGVSIPCFVVDTDHVLLPAFSMFTRGVGIVPRRGAAAYGIADGRVVRVPAAATERERTASCLIGRPR